MMAIEIRLGTEKDIDSLAQLYDDLNDSLAVTTNYPGWRKGVYPVRQDAVDGIDEKCLFVATEHEEIAAQYGKERGIKALRLDVYENNIPAIRLYEKCGYQYIDTVSLGLEDCGLDWFRLYEKRL